MSDVSAAPNPTAPLKLNLGSGQNPLPGYVNVDKFGSPDVMWDLETFPWPWQDNSVDEIRLHHVLEHLGQAIGTYFGIVKELYRICRNGSIVEIAVPHPRHDNFLGDPTHVRPFTPESFTLYSKALNREWREKGYANSPLGLYLDVDFVIEEMQLDPEEPWASRFFSGEITEEQLRQAAMQFNNVISQIHVRWRAVKPQ